MPNALPKFGIMLLLGAAASLRAHSQELITNGNFESSNLQAWIIHSAPGASVSVANGSSPFTNVFSAGKSALLVRDDSADFGLPTVQQSFSAGPTAFLSFDFKASDLRAGSPWYLAWQGDGETTVFFFSIGGADGHSLDLNQVRITGLAANTWYHVEALADAPTETISGVVISQSGQRTEFTSGFPFGVHEVLNSVTLSDGDVGANGDLTLDNVSETLPQINLSLNSQLKPVVQWSGAPAFQLESTAALGSNAVWTAVSAPVSGVFTNSNPDQARFFRLVHH